MFRVEQTDTFEQEQQRWWWWRWRATVGARLIPEYTSLCCENAGGKQTHSFSLVCADHIDVYTINLTLRSVWSKRSAARKKLGCGGGVARVVGWVHAQRLIVHIGGVCPYCAPIDWKNANYQNSAATQENLVLVFHHIVRGLKKVENDSHIIKCFAHYRTLWPAMSRWAVQRCLVSVCGCNGSCSVVKLSSQTELGRCFMVKSLLDLRPQYLRLWCIYDHTTELDRVLWSSIDDIRIEQMMPDLNIEKRSLTEDARVWTGDVRVEQMTPELNKEHRNSTGFARIWTENPRDEWRTPKFA